MRTLSFIVILVLLAPFEAPADDFMGAPAAPRWSWDLAAGLDSYIHTYALATEDTTETVSEYNVQAGFEGRSDPRATHRWQVRGEASTGTELNRERLEGSYRRLDGRRATRLGLSGRLWARQYRRGSEYVRSSNVIEGRGDLLWVPWVSDGLEWRLLGWGAVNDYATPSSLEVDLREYGAGTALRSRGLDGPAWGVALKQSGRTYPDTTEIDRRVWIAEGDFEQVGDDGRELRLYHRSDRRRAADTSVRPHAWTHWTDVQLALPAGEGQVYAEAQSEIWRYSNETDVYLDSWRQEGFLAYGWGDLLAARWKLGLAGERLSAGESPERYTQVGLRAGVESYGAAVSGSLTVEYGRRVYGDAAVGTSSTGVLASEDAADLIYSDFHYWKVWLMGTWQVSAPFAVEAMANYEPESHTEQTDDTSLGFVSLRLVWRP